MNYGYLPLESANQRILRLQPEDEPDRLCIQLYERVTSPAPLKNADVLEVGSGRGGGASYLARYREPKKMVGVDFSPEAAAFCQGRYAKVPHLQFLVGDAEKLPFAESCFDVVVNVESSHCYGNIRKFFSEVTRVLRPGGYFVYADLRTAAEMEELKAFLLAQNDWRKLEEEDITADVAAALKADDTRKRKMIAELVPSDWQPIFKEFAGVDGGKVCQGLEKRELLYFRFVFQRSK